MNVKVVLLPAGEDPDSFARSHSASEFAEFISQNETDFIRFKTKLLLAEAGGDPIKRSALISDIIRTVAIIPDNIARSVYIRECSTTMEIDEQVLLNESIRSVSTRKRTKRLNPQRIHRPFNLQPIRSLSIRISPATNRIHRKRQIPFLRKIFRLHCPRTIFRKRKRVRPLLLHTRFRRLPTYRSNRNALLLRLMSWLFCAISYDMANVSSMTT